jgi:hypothetical protein
MITINKELFLATVKNEKSIDLNEVAVDNVKNLFKITQLRVDNNDISMSTNTLNIEITNRQDNLKMICNNVCRDLNENDYVKEMQININLVSKINDLLALLMKI